MATVEVFTKARMLAIEEQAIVDAELRDGSGTNQDLILIRNNATEINVGNVRGLIGVTPTVPDEVNWKHSGVLVGAAPVGGSGVPAFKLQAGTSVITTNSIGEATITYPEAFNGISSVITQVGQQSDVIFTHINGNAIPDPGYAGCSVENLSLMLDEYTTTKFDVAVASGGGGGAFGFPNPGSRLGGCGTLRINWMAFGW